MGTQVGSDLSVDLLDLDLDLDELGWQRPILVQTPTKKRGEHYFLKLYLLDYLSADCAVFRLFHSPIVRGEKLLLKMAVLVVSIA